MKILLGLDHSEASQAALAEAVSRPWPSGTRFEVVNVVEPAHLWEMGETVEELRLRSEKLVRDASQKLQAAGWQTCGASLPGDPRTVLIDRAKTTGADLIVVGTHGGTLTKFILGNVAASIVRHAPCSVEIVRRRPGAAPPWRILLPTDGSEYSRAAARSIAARPWPAGCEIRVFSVVELVLPPSKAWFEPPLTHSQEMEDLRAQAMKHAEEAVADAVEIVSRAQCSITESISVLIEGPEDVILKEAEDWRPHLIVLGSHGRHGMERFLMGSVSEAVATHAPCSVEVVRR
jgi:nucleotide-binding universal stress UspA family protein